MELSQCMFGALWRKDTKILFLGIDDVSRLQRPMCKSRRGNADVAGPGCCWTGLPHAVSTPTQNKDIDFRGGFQTAMAAHYPAELCSELARLCVGKLNVDWCPHSSQIQCKSLVSVCLSPQAHNHHKASVHWGASSGGCSSAEYFLIVPFIIS